MEKKTIIDERSASAPAGLKATGSVFFDPTQRRARRLIVLFVGLLLFVTGFIATTFYKLAYFPKLETEYLQPEEVLAAQNRITGHIADGSAYPVDCIPVSQEGRQTCVKPSDLAVVQAVRNLPTEDVTLYGFLPFQPDWVHISLARNLKSVDVLMPEKYDLDLDFATLNVLETGAAYQEQINSIIEARRAELKLLPVVRVISRDPGAPGYSKLEASQARRIAERLLQQAQVKGYEGICLDYSKNWSDITTHFDVLIPVFAEIFETAGKEACLSLEFDTLAGLDPADTAGIDHLVVMVGRDTTQIGFQGPLAPLSRVQSQARTIAGRSDANKIVVALGADSVQWNTSSPQPVRLSFVQAMSEIFDAGIQPQVSQGSLNTFAEFTDPDQNFRVIWLSDIVSTFNTVASFADTSVDRFAIWPIGNEDPAIWALFDRGADTGDALVYTDLSDNVIYSGKGPFQSYASHPVTGIRNLTVSDDGSQITGLDQIRMPTPHQIVRWGAWPDNAVVLTFDDGPDPVYTPKILDILRDLDVKATFFVVGDKLNKQRDLVERIVSEGHLVGSHSYSHARLSDKSNIRTRLELAAVQYAFEGISGKNVVLFRMPYNWSTGPIDGTTARPMSDVTEAGYVLVSGGIDPPDWKLMRPEAIVRFVRQELSTGARGMIVMHDGGGTRQNVVEALKPMIEGLRREGYRFHSLADIMDVPPDSLMPDAVEKASLFDRMSFFLQQYLTVVLRGIFWLVVAMGAFRALAVITLSLLRKPHTARTKVREPSVSVLIPAFNEEGVVARSVNAALVSAYGNFNVIVVDDGSTDRTFDVLQRRFGDDPRVTVLHKENGGKSSALNLALAHSTAEIVVAIDADTAITPDAMGLLVDHFSDPKIGAVAGNVKVGNRERILTKFQALEYITAQNIDRRAMELVNGILVVPGSIGAWRKSAVQAAGGYKLVTLAEDADLTVSVIRAGYQVAFEPNAIAITEAPATLRQFMRQRLRWILGMMQVGWKHKSAFWQARGLGLVSIPDLFFFGVVMPVLAPLADIAFLLAIFNLASGALSAAPEAYDPQSAVPVILAYLALPMLDILIATLAFWLEPRERPRLILLVLFQRFFYRQFLYFSAYRALWRAFSGQFEGWQKIRRQPGALIKGTDTPVGRGTG